MQFQRTRRKLVQPGAHPVVAGSPPAPETSAKTHEEESHWHDRLKKAAAGIMAAIAVEQGLPSMPDPGPGPVIMHTLDTTQATTANASDPAPLLDWSGQASHGLFPEGSVTLPPGFLLHFNNDPIDRIGAAIAAAQPQAGSTAEAGAVKDVLRQVYRDVVDLLHNHEKMAHVIADAAVGKAVEAAIDELPECASAILIAIGLKKRASPAATASLDQTAMDLERINALYAEGVPLTLVKVEKILGINEARARAALQAGLYEEEWHPAGVAELEPAGGPTV